MADIENPITVLTANVNGLIREMKDFKDEMRQQYQMRAEEIREIRTKLDGMGNHVRNLVWTSMAAIGAMVVTVIVSLVKG